jgi:hypothetical protein
MRTIAISSKAVVILASFLLPYTSSQPTENSDPAVASARTRQETVKTLNIKFRCSEVIAKGGMYTPVPGSPHPEILIPAQETTLEWTNHLVIDEDKVRCENNRPTQWGVTEKWVERSQVYTFNGSVAKIFFPGGLSGAKDPMGSIDNSAPRGWSSVLTPILMTFRGLNRSIALYAISEMNPSGNTVLIDGAMCQEYLFKLSSGFVVGCWLDPANDYIVRRIRSEQQGRLGEQTDVRYCRNDTCGWVPSSWVRKVYSPAGSVRWTTTVEVLDMRLNEPQAAEQFDIQFPPGTLVSDNRNSKSYRVQSDGNMRELSPSGEEPPVSLEVSEEPWYWRDRWLLISLGVLFTVALLLHSVQRRRSTRDA